MGFFSKLFKNKYEDMDESQLEIAYENALSYNNLGTCHKIIEAYLKRQDNYKYLEGHKEIFINEITTSVLTNGYTLSNDFLLFITKIKTDKFIPLETIRFFFEKGDLNSDDSFLYEESLYDDTNSNNEYRIKALVYARHPEYQVGASKEINLNSLINKDGTVKTTEEIREILGSITVEK